MQKFNPAGNPDRRWLMRWHQDFLLILIGQLNFSHALPIRARCATWMRDLDVRLRCDPWVPMMSGVSGNRIIVMPNGLIYYYLNDEQKFPLTQQILAANEVMPFCA